MTDRKISELPAASLPLVGTEQVPIAQGGETRRVNAAVLGGVSTGRVSGSYFSTTPMGGAGETPTANRMRLFPYTPERAITIQRFQIRTHNTPGASNFALAIYDCGESGLPIGAPLYGGAAFTPTYNFTYVGYSGLSLMLPVRRLWLAFVASAAAGSYTQINEALGDSSKELLTLVGNSDTSLLATSNNGNIGPFVDGVTPGVWPTLTGQFSDFSGRDRPFRYPTFSFQVA